MIERREAFMKQSHECPPGYDHPPQRTRPDSLPHFSPFILSVWRAGTNAFMELKFFRSEERITRLLGLCFLPQAEGPGIST